MGQNHLVAVDHALVAVVLGVGGGEGGLMGGVGVVLGLIPRRGEGHGQARAGVSLSTVGVAWVASREKKTDGKRKEVKGKDGGFF